MSTFIRILLPVMINESSYLLDIRTPFEGTAMQSFTLCFSISGSKVGAQYRSTLFADPNLEISHIFLYFRTKIY